MSRPRLYSTFLLPFEYCPLKLLFSLPPSATASHTAAQPLLLKLRMHLSTILITATLNIAAISAAPTPQGQGGGYHKNPAEPCSWGGHGPAPPCSPFGGGVDASSVIRLWPLNSESGEFCTYGGHGPLAPGCTLPPHDSINAGGGHGGPASPPRRIEDALDWDTPLPDAPTTDGDCKGEKNCGLCSWEKWG